MYLDNFVVDNFQLREAINKKKNIKKKFKLGFDPPPLIEKIFDVFFSETRPLLGHFWKKKCFCPLEISNEFSP